MKGKLRRRIRERLRDARERVRRLEAEDPEGDPTEELVAARAIVEELEAILIERRINAAAAVVSLGGDALKARMEAGVKRAADQLAAEATSIRVVPSVQEVLISLRAQVEAARRGQARAAEETMAMASEGRSDLSPLDNGATVGPLARRLRHLADLAERHRILSRVLADLEAAVDSEPGARGVIWSQALVGFRAVAEHLGRSARLVDPVSGEELHAVGALEELFLALGYQEAELEGSAVAGTPCGTCGHSRNWHIGNGRTRFCRHPRGCECRRFVRTFMRTELNKGGDRAGDS